MKSYSQFNEDIFLKEFFEKKNIKNGFFLSLVLGMEYIYQIVDCYLRAGGQDV
jgi:hypothetical protein